MTAYEAIGMAFVIFTSTLASIALVYLAIVGLRSVLKMEKVGANLAKDLKLSDGEIERVGRR